DRGHGRDLCGHDRLQRDARPALPLDAPEALAGLALRERRPGEGRQRPGDRPQGRSVSVQGVSVQRYRRMPPADARQPASVWQHGDPRQRAADRPAHARRGQEGEMTVEELYQAVIDAWNKRDADAFATLFTLDGECIGFDGSTMTGRGTIAEQ